MGNNKMDKQLNAWEQAMRCGILRGRPYSESCIGVYTYYADWFLKTYGNISIANFKRAMMDMPIESFAKRLKIYEAVNCFVRFLVDEKQMDGEYLEEVKRYKPRRHLPITKTVVDEEGINKLLRVCRTPTERIVLLFLSQTGLRATEAGNLTLEDINLDQRFLVVKRAKWGKTRRVGLTARALQAIYIYLRERPETGSDHFLVETDGKPMNRKTLLYCCRRLSKRAGIKVTPHALRRAFVTINANKGRPLPMLQMACGHSDIATTRSYCMTTEDEAIEAMQGWD